MNGVCTHIVRLDQQYKRLRYYTGNYDSYVATRRYIRGLSTNALKLRTAHPTH